MSRKIVAPMTGTVWKVMFKEGESFDAGDTVAILESMKMEIPVEAENAGTVLRIDAPEGTVVDDGTTILTLA